MTLQWAPILILAAVVILGSIGVFRLILELLRGLSNRLRPSPAPKRDVSIPPR